MPSAFTHAVAALALGSFLPPTPERPRIWLAGALCAALPDLDVLGLALGIRYGDLLGHRGLTHSLAFAAALAALVTLACPRPARGPAASRWGLWTYLFLATASHGLLDMLTDGGLGVALFSPFDLQRLFFPWRPIAVSPIGVARFFSPRGFAVLASEVRWVWLPCALLILAGWAWNRRGSDVHGR
jgi:inner membrane protein